MRQPKFRIADVECCYVCQKAIKDADGVSCKGKGLISPIGLCNWFKKIPDVSLSKCVEGWDNLNDETDCKDGYMKVRLKQ
jgi:hypothetical protein